jgi:integrase
MQGKQAKIVSPTQERAMPGYLDTTRYPSHDHVMFLLSMKAGLRAKETASLTWAMVTDAQGQIAEAMHVPNRASKGTTGGRTIPLHPDLQAALGTLQTGRGDMATPERLIHFSKRGGSCRPPPCACGSIGCIRRSRWMAVRRTQAAGPSLRAPRAKCRRSGGASGTCRNSPATRAWR